MFLYAKCLKMPKNIKFFVILIMHLQFHSVFLNFLTANHILQHFINKFIKKYYFHMQ